MGGQNDQQVEGYYDAQREERELYTLYRDYIKHEDSLINNRVGWFIQLHSFLIASYGILFSALLASFFPSGKAAAGAGDIQAIACYLFYAVAAVGSASSIAAIFSISAAQSAISTLESGWKTIPRTQTLPGIVGGGHVTSNRFGASLHRGLPFTLLIVWVCSIAVPLRFSAVLQRPASAANTTATPAASSTHVGAVTFDVSVSNVRSVAPTKGSVDQHH